MFRLEDIIKIMKTETLAIIIMASIAPTGFQVVYAQVLDRDMEAPTPGLNGTASAEPPAVSIDISPLESLPINGTVTNHGVTIEEPETETEEPDTE